MINIYLTIAVIICAAIDLLRIKTTWGRVANINHPISVIVAAMIFALLIIMDGLVQWQSMWLVLAYAGTRGTLYDPLLNILLGRYIDAESETTSSKIDAKEKKRKINFWMQRLLYLLLWVVSYFLYFISLKIWPL